MHERNFIQIKKNGNTHEQTIHKWRNTNIQ